LLTSSPVGETAERGIGRRLRAPLIFIAVGLIAGLVRLPTVGTRGIYADEALSGLIARDPLGSLFTAVAAAESHPPLYHLILHFWRFTGPLGIRLLSVIAGGLSAAGIFVLAREFWPKRVAVLATLLTVLSPFQVWYSQVARMYSLVTLFGLVSSWLMLRLIVAGDERKRVRIAYWCSTLGMVYTHYFGLLLLAAQLVFVLTRPQPRRRQLRDVGFMLSPVVALVPWLFWAMSRHSAAYSAQLQSGIGVAPKTAILAAASFAYAAFVGDIYPRLAIILMAAGIAAIVGISLARAWPSIRASQLDRFCALAAGIPILTAAALAGAVPKLGSPRYLLLISPYVEDVDWCLRMRDAGFTIRSVGAAAVYHPDTRARDMASPVITYLMIRNSLLLLEKRGATWRVRLQLTLIHIRTIAALLSRHARTSGNRIKAAAIIRGLVDAYRHELNVPKPVSAPRY
jgi:Dolichyl-phosphate-mannose-protein mannosyltransferase